MNKILKGIVKALPIIGVMIFLIAILIIFGAVPRSYYLNSFDGFSVIEGETNMGFEAKLKIAISQRDTAQYKYDKSKTALEEANKEKKNAETDFMLAQERLRLAKQYMLHTGVLQLINSSDSPTQFKNFRLVPVEGLYRPESGEDLDVSDGINFLMSRGRTVVYELIDNKGNMAVEKTFDLAVYFKDNLNYEKMFLDYDNFNPDDSLNVQIIITMPEIIPPYQVTYKNEFETRYNNITQATNELIEVLRTDEESKELV